MRPAEAADGPAALKALAQAKTAQDPFLIAILDMQMPGMDGDSLGCAIKADSNLRDTRLVMCTSLGQSGSSERLEAIGFVATLTKPVRRQELREILEAAISGKPTTAFGASSTPGFALAQGSRPARILVAEDNITNQQVAMGMLQKLGLRADVAANGAEAVQAIATIPYDLVLMDVQMPEIDGLEASRLIRKAEAERLRAKGCDPSNSPRIPIIAMTAHALQGDRDKCLQAGMDGYITKPVEVPALVAALKEWLKPKDVGRQPLEGGTMEDRSASTLQKATPIFDRAALMDRIMNDQELARVVTAGFLGDLPRQIERLKHGVAGGDARQVEQQAHRIKGASATVGGMALSLIAGTMEKAGQAGDLHAAKACLTDLETQFYRLKEAIKTEL